MTVDVSTPGRAHLLRAGAWFGLALLAVVRFAVLAIGPDTLAARVFSEFAYVAPIALACGGVMVVARRSSGAERRFWACLAGSLALIALSEAYLSYYALAVDPAGPKLPAGFQLLQVGAIALFFALVVMLARFGRATRTQRARYFVGAAAGLVALFVGVLEYLVVPLLSGIPGVTDAAVVVSAIVPVLGVALLVSTFGVLFGADYRRWRPWEWLVIASLSLYAVGMFMMPLWYRGLLTGAPETPLGPFTDVGLSAAPYFMFMAAIYRLTSDDSADALVPGPVLDESTARLRIVYPTVLFLLVPAIGAHALTHAGQSQATVLLASALTLAGLLLLRSWLVSLEAAEHLQLSSRDALTGLSNERSLRAALPLDVAEANRYGGQIAFVVLDVDDLTRVNELFGHLAGDEVMRGVAGILRSACHERGSAYRLGSDEFALTCPGMAADEAGEMARSVCRLVERDVGAPGISVTVSAGVSSFQTSPDAEKLISDAFMALQTAKLLQRGSVSLFGDRQPVLPGPDERLELARKESYLSTMRALAAAVDARDPAAREHSRRVGRLARQVGTELGLDPLRVSALETAGFVHDIGKLALPDELLGKHELGTEKERCRMREHVELGEQILRSTELAFMLPWVRSHHERWDGAGYPDGLAGEAIPLEARIIAVCNSFDAMVSGMWHGSPLSEEAALQELDLGMGTQFDPRVAEAFIRVRSPELRESGSGRPG